MEIRRAGPILVFAGTALLVACGGGGGGGGGSAPAPSLSLFAGNPGGPGNLDGSGTAARFNGERAVAADAAGNIYVADTFNHVVRKITPGGVVSTFAGSPGVIGSTDGTGGAARFNLLSGIATDTAGNAYVTDSANNTVRKITPGGVVSTLAGTAGAIGSADGTGPAASFNFPDGIAVDSAGNIYVTDNGNHTLRKITSAGVVTTLAGSPGAPGSANGTGAVARFNFPVGVAVDGTGNIYVADTSNHTIRKVTGTGDVTTLAGFALMPGTTDGSGASARFNLPFGIVTDTAGTLYVADTGNHAIRKVTSAGAATTFSGAPTVPGSADGAGSVARFNFPFSVTIGPSGNLFVADQGNSTVRSVTLAAVVTTFAGTAGFPGSADGAGAAASFSFPFGVAADTSGNVFVVDNGNHTVRQITPAGSVSTLAGSPGVSGNSDGTGAASHFLFPVGVVPDGAGNIYVADTSNHTIRKISAAGVVTTVAGAAGVAGNNDGTGGAATFNQPWGIAIDTGGNLYVADKNNQRIRKMTAAGVVITLAGQTVAGSADGTGAAAQFNNPIGIAVDAIGNVYVADSGNHTIRKITPGAVVTTLAGAAGSAAFADGIGAAARFNAPRLLAVDSAGNIYVADTNNHTVRKITPAAEVTTVVGSPNQFGLLPGPLPGSLAFPQAVAISGSSLYVTFPNGVAVVQNRP